MGKRRGGYHDEIPVTQELQKKASNGHSQNKGIFLCFAFVLCFNLHFTTSVPELHLACAIP